MILLVRTICAGALFAVAACNTVERSENGSAGAAALAGIGELCGGVAGIGCADENAFCRLPEGVCLSTADASGKCDLKPRICSMEYAPVCGCDGKTYPNACAASGAGVSIASKGACPADE